MASGWLVGLSFQFPARIGRRGGVGFREEESYQISLLALLLLLFWRIVWWGARMGWLVVVVVVLVVNCGVIGANAMDGEEGTNANAKANLIMFFISLFLSLYYELLLYYTLQ